MTYFRVTAQKHNTEKYLVNPCNFVALRAPQVDVQILMTVYHLEDLIDLGANYSL